MTKALFLGQFRASINSFANKGVPMSDLMHEIDEELRQEKLRTFWKENGAWIIGGILLALVMTAGMGYWRNHQATKEIVASQQLIAAAEAANKEALGALATDTKGAHAGFAGLISAGMYAREGQTQRAIEIYDRVAAMRGLPDTYRDLATLLSASHKLDSGDPADLHKILDKLAKKSTWRFSALEMQALLYAREGKMKDAVNALTDISANADAPEDMRRRASTLRELYLGAEGTKADAGQ